MRKNRNKQQGSLFPTTSNQYEEKIKAESGDDPDLIIQTYNIQQIKVTVTYIKNLIDEKRLDDSILTPLLYHDLEWDSDALINELPTEQGQKVNLIEDINYDLIRGHVVIYVENEPEAVSYIISKRENRPLAKAENESLVVGPQLSFTESLSINLNVIRHRINSTELITEKFMVGKKHQTEVRIVYLKSLANDDDVQTMKQRIQNLQVDDVEDSTVLTQYIEDSTGTLFPQFYQTELPDRFCYSISKGKVGVLMEGSPNGVIAPTTFFSFFESTEDVYFKWNIGSFIRALRIAAMFISFVLTPIYVAIVTFHYPVIPTPLLITLGLSRSQVPFPPLFEVLLLELAIELLREAGARLPTKIGQTIGIVGGIVLGQAAVDAGLTSSILIIIIAMSALASFTAPSYYMGSAVRIIRFPMIILASMLGLIGVMFGICLLSIHLLRITSLGRPYMVPVYPFIWKDLDNSLFRLPFSISNKRALSYRLKDSTRYQESNSKQKRDIDE